METSKTLPTLIREASEIASMLAESGGEVTPELELLVEQSGQSLAQKADHYGFVISALEAQSKLASQRIAEWTAFLSASDRAIESMKTRMMYGMQALNLTEISGSETVFTLRNNPPSCEIIDQSKLPGEFLITETPEPVTKIDKRGILEAMKAGKDVPGAQMIRKQKLVAKAGAK